MFIFWFDSITTVIPAEIIFKMLNTNFWGPKDWETISPTGLEVEV